MLIVLIGYELEMMNNFIILINVNIIVLVINQQ